MKKKKIRNSQNLSNSAGLTLNALVSLSIVSTFKAGGFFIKDGTLWKTKNSRN